MTFTPPPIFITDKQKSATDSTRIPVAFRQIERWVGNLRIPTGGGGGGVYASLTGPGQTTTPGDLTQAGGFEVDAPASSGRGIQLSNLSPVGITLSDAATSGGGIQLDTHHDIQLNALTGIQLNPGSTPLGSGFNMELNASQQLNGGTEVNGYLHVYDTSTSPGIHLEEGGSGGITLTTLTGPGDITVQASGTARIQGNSNLYLLTNPGGGSSALQIINYGTGGTLINSNSAVDIIASGHDMTFTFGGLLILATLPTSAPLTTGALWNNGGVVHVV